MKSVAWQRASVADICESIVDCVNKTAAVVDGPTPYKMIRTTNVKKGWVNLAEVKYVSEEVFEKWTRRQRPRKGDVILTREAPLGEVGMLRSNDHVFLGQRLVSYRANPKKLDNRFLLYAFQHDDLQGQIKGLGSGATVEHMRVPDCEKLTLPLPSLDEQRRIASILSAYDDLIENNTRRIAILEEMARRIYEEWFVRFRFPGHEKVRMVESELGLIPEGWSVGRLDDAIVLQRGFDLPAKDRQPGEYPVIAATGVHGSNIEGKVKGPGVVTGRSGSLGTVLYIHEDHWPLNTTLWVKEFKHATPLFAYYLLKGLDFAGLNAGAAVPTLNRNDVHAIRVSLPPDTLLSAFDNIVQPVFNLLRTLTQKNTNLRATRDLLLPKLISGELDVSRLPEAEAMAA